MNAQMSELLEQMKTQLVAEEPAWGPNSVVSTDHDDDGEPGESGAENSSDVMDAFDLYLSSILDALLEQYEADEEEALDFIFAVAEEMADAGTLPEIPEDDDGDDADVVAWVGTAKTAGFLAAVMAAAEESGEEDEDEE